ncbi:MAG: hypothetical protein KKB51_06205 [Candidatus Riflebacteria bacterium]|nr:hypothetical protein [Candidatus Riflebacteria bacterium]
MRKTELYTLIIDFRDGTYVTQALANDLLTAPFTCIENWDIRGIEEVSENCKADILSQLKDEKFVPLNGMKNVWCGCAMLNNKAMLMNLVKTKRAT